MGPLSCAVVFSALGRTPARARSLAAPLAPCHSVGVGDPSARRRGLRAHRRGSRDRLRAAAGALLRSAGRARRARTGGPGGAPRTGAICRGLLAALPWCRRRPAGCADWRVWFQVCAGVAVCKAADLRPLKSGLESDVGQWINSQMALLVSISFALVRIRDGMQTPVFVTAALREKK